MKKIISCILVFCMISSFICTMPAMAEDETFVYGEFLYQIPSWNNSVCEIVGLNTDVEDLVIPGVINGLRVFELGNMAFLETDIKTVTIEEGVTYTGNNTFSDCNNLTICILPKSLKSVQYAAFSNCKNLETVIIKNPKTVIGEYAFYGSNVKDVYFAGNEQDWNMIRATSDDGLDSATVHFNYKAEETKNITVYINNKQIAFDVPPVIENGTTLVPVRAIFEAMGMVVDWDKETSSVIAEGNGNVSILPVGKNTATVNGKDYSLSVPAKVVEGRTLVPLRFVAESVGATVQWDQKEKRVDISYDNKVTLQPKFGDMAHYYVENGTLYIEGGYYAYLDIVHANGKSVYNVKNYTIESYSKNVVVDAYRTISVNSNYGSYKVKLKDIQGNTCDTLNVEIIENIKTNDVSIKLKNGNTYNSYQYDHETGYNDLFRYCNVIFLRPYQSVAVELRDKDGKLLEQSELAKLSWEIEGEGIKIGEDNTLSSTGKNINADLYVKNSSGRRISHVRIISFNPCQFQPLDFINSETYINYDNLALRKLSAKQVEGGYLVNFDLYNGWFVPIQVSVYNKNEELIKSVVANGVWSEVSTTNAVIEDGKAAWDVFSLKIFKKDYINTNLYESRHVEVTVPRGGYIAFEYPKDGNDAQAACYFSILLRTAFSTKDLIDEAKNLGLNVDEDTLIQKLDMQNLIGFFKEKLGSEFTKNTSIELKKKWEKHFADTFIKAESIDGFRDGLFDAAHGIDKELILDFTKYMVFETMIPFGVELTKESIDTAIERTLNIDWLFLGFDIVFDNLQMDATIRQAKQAQNLSSNKIGYLIAPVS